jgi:hypothetical protein
MNDVLIWHISRKDIVRWKNSRKTYFEILRSLVSLFNFASDASRIPHSILFRKQEKARHQMRNLIKLQVVSLGLVMSVGLFSELPNEIKEKISHYYFKKCDTFDHFINSQGLNIISNKLKLSDIWFSKNNIIAIEISIQKNYQKIRLVNSTKCEYPSCICPPIQSTYDLRFYCSIHVPNHARWLRSGYIGVPIRTLKLQ